MVFRDEVIESKILLKVHVLPATLVYFYRRLIIFFGVLQFAAGVE